MKIEKVTARNAEITIIYEYPVTGTTKITKVATKITYGDKTINASFKDVYVAAQYVKLLRKRISDNSKEVCNWCFSSHKYKEMSITQDSFLILCPNCAKLADKCEYCGDLYHELDSGRCRFCENK